MGAEKPPEDVAGCVVLATRDSIWGEGKGRTVVLRRIVAVGVVKVVACCRETIRTEGHARYW